MFEYQFINMEASTNNFKGYMARKMKAKSSGRTRKTSVVSDAVAAFALLTIYKEVEKCSSLFFPGASASDLAVNQHSNAIINMYNNDECIHNIGCHERPVHILLDVSKPYIITNFQLTFPSLDDFYSTIEFTN